jgi:hypothetical protein
MVRPQVACNLTLVSVNADDSAVVLFPNRFRQETYIPAGKVLTLPGDAAPFTFRLNDAGTETVHAFCNARNRWSGISHDFGRKPFTPIASFSDYLAKRDEHEDKNTGLARFPFIGNASITFGVE